MKQVAVRAGKPQAWLSDRLRGRSPIYADDLLLLAKALEVDPCDFFRESSEDEKQPASADSPEARTQRLTGRILRELDDVPEQDLELFFDFLEWRRQRQPQER